MKNIKLLALSTLIFVQANAQEDYFKIGTEFRARSEIRNGYRTLSTDSSKTALFNGQRVRLIFDYKKDNITFFPPSKIREYGAMKSKKRMLQDCK